MNVRRYRQQVLDAAASVGVTIRELEPDRTEELRTLVSQRFTHTDRFQWLWEDLRERVSVRDPGAWRWIDGIVPSRPVVFFYNLDVDPTMFEFRDATDLVALLGETNEDEFYVTNPTADFLICFNHHDVLTASGTAEPRLTARLAHEERGDG